jgi:Ca2+-dependent lipid-binding protein
MCSVCIPLSTPTHPVAHTCPAGFPDPFAVATINGEQTRTTSVIKKTLNPYWNESFDMYVILCRRLM